MKVIKEKSEFGLNIILEDSGKYLAFTFGGNGDLYWSIRSERENENYDYFVITKENYAIYSLFEQLFFDVENINIFDEEDIPFYIDSEEERREYLKKSKKRQEETKVRCRLFNQSNYNELFDNNQTITWYSDETAHEVANILRIKKEEDIFKLEFYTQPYKEGYDMDFHISNYIPIRFRNSGSSYNPFNIIFMQMYNSMKEIDDTHDFGHQVHIEEYLYNVDKVKKLTLH